MKTSTFQSLLSPDYMAAQIHNGLVVDIIQTQPADQHVIQSHEIYANHQPLSQITPTTMHSHQIGERSYLDQTQQPNDASLIAQCHPANGSLHRENEMNKETVFAPHQDSAASVIMSDQDRRLTTAFLNYMQKQSTLLNNETPVIVANKEMNAVASMGDIEIDNNFVASLTTLDAQQPTDLTSVLSTKIQPQQSLPPLPPLTPISKMQTVRRTRDLPSQQQIIQYKRVADNIQYLQAGIDESKGHSMSIGDGGGGSNEGISMLVPTERALESAPLTAAPKKSLPHKKRITKKLKSISPIDELQTHVQPNSEVQYQHLSHTSFLQQPKVVESSRIQIIQASDFSAAQTLTIQNAPEKPQAQASQVALFTCELCGYQCSAQLCFFHHLKIHYEPSGATMKIETIKSSEAENSIEANGIDLSTSAFDELHASSPQNIFDLSTTAMNNHFVNNTISVVTHQTVANAGDGLNDEDDDEDVHNENASDHYGESQMIKSEENELSETEYIISSEVVDMSGHSLGDVKSIIGLSTKSGPKEWFQHDDRQLHSNVVYHIDKSSVIDASAFHLSQDNDQQVNSVTESIPAGSSQQPMDQYELSMHEKEMTEDYAPVLNENSHSGHEIPASEVNNGAEEKGKAQTSQQTLSIKNIQHEFIEEEKTDSDSDAVKPNGVRKKKKLYRCRRCDKLCNSKNALHYHFLSHTGERPHQCEICGKSFFASCALKVHKRLHSGDKPYDCSFCSRPFRQWGDLKYHIQSKHTTEKNHQCEFCGKDFARRYSLVIHRRIHTGEKNYKCEFCDKQFRASSYLQVHRKIHTGEKPYVCGVCGKKFRVRGDLKRHSNIHKRANEKETLQNEEADNTGDGFEAKPVLFQVMEAAPSQEGGLSADAKDEKKNGRNTRNGKGARKAKSTKQHHTESEEILNYSISGGDNRMATNNCI